MPETSFDFSSARPNHCNLADSVITCCTRKQFDCCFFVLPLSTSTDSPGYTRRMSSFSWQAGGVICIYRQPLSGPNLWANDVGNEHWTGEGLHCLVTFQTAGVGRLLQVHPPGWALCSRLLPSASQFTLLAVKSQVNFSSFTLQAHKCRSCLMPSCWDLYVHKGSHSLHFAVVEAETKTFTQVVEPGFKSRWSHTKAPLHAASAHTGCLSLYSVPLMFSCLILTPIMNLMSIG